MVNRSRKILFLVGYCPALRHFRLCRVTPSLSSIAHRFYLSLKNFAAFGKSKRSLVKEYSLRKNKSAKSIFGLLMLAIPMRNISCIFHSKTDLQSKSENHTKRLITVLNRRFRSDPALRTEYTAFVDEYEELGHMKKVAINATNSQRIYTPRITPLSGNIASPLILESSSMLRAARQTRCRSTIISKSQTSAPNCKQT